MTPADTPLAPKGTRRGIKIALALSLALNLCVAGVVGGAALRARGDGGHERRIDRNPGLSPLTQALTREQRRDMARAMGEGGGLRGMRAQMRAEVGDILTALRADPVDPVAVQEAFARQGRNLAQRADVGRMALVDLVLAMSPAERAAFVERLEDGQSRRTRQRE